jgi:hypothetical protein
VQAHQAGRKLLHTGAEALCIDAGNKGLHRAASGVVCTVHLQCLPAGAVRGTFGRSLAQQRKGHGKRSWIVAPSLLDGGVGAMVMTLA